MALRVYNPNDVQYKIPDYNLRKLFLKVFQDKHELKVYRYKGQHRQTFCCDGRQLEQDEAWADFQKHAAHLQAVLRGVAKRYVREKVR